MIGYCNDIEETAQLFGKTFDMLKTSKPYKHAVAMCILQIGELTIYLSENFKEQYNDMPWKEIKKMRNIAAHNYGNFELDILWNTMTEDIPALRDYCQKILDQTKETPQ